MDIPIIHPPCLCPGDTFGIAAPASPIKQRDDLKRGIITLQRMGFHVRFEERVSKSPGYLAGDDFARAEELMRYIEDPTIHAIIGLRGGYGCSRLIPLLSEDRLRPCPKIFVGFSDLTTLQLFFFRRFGWVTIHGPMAASPAFGNMGAAQEKHFYSLLTDPGYLPSLSFPHLEAWVPGVAEGTLIGGCLSLVVTSLGTIYEIDTEGKILFLEDFDEPPYRIDRMLTHLRLAGKLESIAGLLLGSFYESDPTRGGDLAKDTLRNILNTLKVPILANFPAGHGPDNWAIPLGSRVRIDADECSVQFLEPAVRAK